MLVNNLWWHDIGSAVINDKRFSIHRAIDNEIDCEIVPSQLTTCKQNFFLVSNAKNSMGIKRTVIYEEFFAAVQDHDL